MADLRPGTEYEARVHINCTSETPRFISQRFTTTLYDETTFFPNPTEDRITIRPSKDLIGHQFNLYDPMGRNVASGQLLDYTIDLSGLSAGTYTLRIEGGKTFRIIKR